MTSRADVRARAAEAVRAARQRVNESRRALVDFRRQAPRLLAARRRVLTLELKRHRSNVRATTDEKRQQIAAARRELADYRAKQAADLKRHKAEVTAAFAAYRRYLRAVEHAKLGKLDKAQALLRDAGSRRPVASRAEVATRRRARESKTELWALVFAELEGEPAARESVRTEAQRAAMLRTMRFGPKVPLATKAHRIVERLREQESTDTARALADLEDRAGAARAGAALVAAAVARESAPLAWTVTQERAPSFDGDNASQLVQGWVAYQPDPLTVYGSAPTLLDLEALLRGQFPGDDFRGVIAAPTGPLRRRRSKVDLSGVPS